MVVDMNFFGLFKLKEFHQRCYMLLTQLTCCSNSSWVGGTDVAEIAYVGYVVDGVEGPAEMEQRINALFHFYC